MIPDRQSLPAKVLDALVGLTLLAGAALFNSTPADLLPQTLKIAINKDEVFGSGTVIGYRDSKPLVLTCAHVVDETQAKITVDGHPAHIFLIDKNIDLAVVELDEHAVYPVAAIATVAPVSGDEELVVGYPLARYETITRGYFSVPIDDVAMEGSAPVYPGNSGGGAYSWHILGGWQLAGVANAVAIGRFEMGRYIAPNVSYTIQLNVVRSFLKRLDNI